MSPNNDHISVSRDTERQGNRPDQHMWTCALAGSSPGFCSTHTGPPRRRRRRRWPHADDVWTGPLRLDTSRSWPLQRTDHLYTLGTRPPELTGHESRTRLCNVGLTSRLPPALPLVMARSLERGCLDDGMCGTSLVLMNISSFLMCRNSTQLSRRSLFSRKYKAATTPHASCNVQDAISR